MAVAFRLTTATHTLVGRRQTPDSEWRLFDNMGIKGR